MACTFEAASTGATCEGEITAVDEPPDLSQLASALDATVKLSCKTACDSKYDSAFQAVPQRLKDSPDARTPRTAKGVQTPKSTRTAHSPKVVREEQGFPADTFSDKLLEPCPFLANYFWNPKLGCLGIGRYGKVFECYLRKDTLLYPRCVKVVPCMDKESREAFKEECNVLRKLAHLDTVVDFYNAFVLGNLGYVVTELVRGWKLSDVEAQLRHVHDKKLVERIVKQTARQLFQALADIHGCGIAHMDLKPDNILFRPDGSLCLIDFGLAQEYQPGWWSTYMAGTLEYMAPEIVAGFIAWADEEDVKPYAVEGADMWSAGVVLYELLTGQLPFQVSRQEGERAMDKLIDEWRVAKLMGLDHVVLSVLAGCTSKKAPCHSFFKRLLMVDWPVRMGPTAALDHHYLQRELTPSQCRSEYVTLMERRASSSSSSSLSEMSH